MTPVYILHKMQAKCQDFFALPKFSTVYNIFLSIVLFWDRLQKTNIRYLKTFFIIEKKPEIC